MESGLLNAFHDDQYDINNCAKYEEDNNFWSDGTNTLGLQLSETLHGILPISATDDSHIYFSDEIETQYSVELQQNELGHDIYGIPNNDEDIIYRSLNNVMSSSPSIELIPVDVNSEFNDCSKNHNNTNSEFSSNDSDTDDDNNGEDLNELRTCSRSTFRSRTDSSSIGDYESHSSDDEDDSIACSYKNENESIVYVEDLMNNKLINKTHQIENNHNLINSVDNYTTNILQKLEKTKFDASNDLDEIADIDVKDFDLAKFITEDYGDDNDEDDVYDDSYASDLRICLPNKNSAESDDNSDIEVDIETVNDCEKSDTTRNSNDTAMTLIQPELHKSRHYINNNNICMEDDTEKDPSWKPPSSSSSTSKIINSNSNKKIITNPKQRTPALKNIQRKFNVPVYKNQLMATKNVQTKKFGIGRGGKNISMCSKPSISSSEDDDIPVDNKLEIKNINTNPEVIISPKKSPLENKIKPKLELNNKEEIVCQSSNELTNDSSANNVTSNPVKRKLNLEEYKRRRENPTFCNIKMNPDYKIVTMTNTVTNPTITNNSNASNIPNATKREEQLNNGIVGKPTDTTKSIPNDPKLIKIVLDPITEAKNKVLRMQALKKQAAQNRLIDFTVSAKVGPVTKILPLEEIVNGKGKNLKALKQKQNSSEYEEIIIVSVSCNTDIKIPPNLNHRDTTNLNSLSSKISKSTALLYNISNTIQRVESTENMKISNNSLISSIQNVVFRKSVVANKNSLLKITQAERKAIHSEPQNKVNEETKTDVEVQQQQHGEDKIIMHLPKNRIRKPTHTISTQTDILPEFPPLELILDKKINNINNDAVKRRKYRSRTTNYSSDDDDDDDDHDHDYVYDRKYKSRSKSPQQYNRLTTNENLQSNNNTNSSSESERDRRSRDRNRRIYSTSPSCSERSYSSSSSISNKSSSRNRKRSRSRSRFAYRRIERKRGERQNSPAVEERRIVYVGRIEAETTKDDIKRKFQTYGPVKQITLHYKDTGMKYGFVTFERAEDAFNAIDNGMRDPKINVYDISFGGRRAFCRATYSDLDGAATNTFQTYTYPTVPNRNVVVNNDPNDSFETLLQQMKDRICSSKSSGTVTSTTTSKPTATNPRLKT